VSEEVVVGAGADSLCHLLDAAYLLACTALDTTVDQGAGGSSSSSEASAAMLPSLVPLLRLVSSITPRHGGNVCDVLANFFPDAMAYVCLQGCSYICCSLTTDNNAKRSPEAAEVHERLVQAVLGVVASLHCIARVMGTSGEDRGFELLQNALEPPVVGTNSVTNGTTRFVASSPALLYNIASSSLHNVGFTKDQRVALVSAALGTMTDPRHKIQNRPLPLCHPFLPNINILPSK